MFALIQNFKRVKKALCTWNRTTFGNIFQSVIDAEDKVLAEEMKFELDNSPENRESLQLAKANLNKKLQVEESFWTQKANIKWAIDGDTNSKYFHSVVKKRRNKSKISKIKLQDGSITHNQDIIKKEAVDFFKNLLDANKDCSMNFNSLNGIPSLLNEADKDYLDENPSLDEVKEAIWNMNKNSAPGLDGLNGYFFTSVWDFVQDDIYQAVCQFFVGSEIPKAISTTLIALIPKVDNPQHFSNFRPISLCNFFNKIISKILADRLANILPKIISENQSGFVKKRDIVDNILLAQEFISTLNKKSSGKNIAIKLDMRKAYDKVSWQFLICSMRKFGFSEIWNDRVWRLISNIHISILVNGSPFGFFKTSNGLRQGDPLSSGLFILCSEVLSRNLNSLPYEGWKPFKAPVGSPIITHLAFADDIIIFSSLNVSCFMWKYFHKDLPLDSQLQALGIQIASQCNCCKESPGQPT